MVRIGFHFSFRRRMKAVTKTAASGRRRDTDENSLSVRSVVLAMESPAEEISAITAGRRLASIFWIMENF